MKLRTFLSAGLTSLFLWGGCNDCGDEFIDGAAGEECDDGNRRNNDGCSSECIAEVCGDGSVQGDEVCDDGNTTGGDGCSADCSTIEVAGVCGDGVPNLGEECDDGNFLPGDACDPICDNPPVEDVFTANDVNQQLVFDLAEYCDGMTTRHATVHEKDKEDNNLRWRCGDVTAIDPSLYGQEYCEYNAVSNGNRINSAANIVNNDLSCVITAVFNDETSLDDQLLQEMALPENLGVSLGGDRAIIRLQRQVNGRGAAIGLISICSTMGGDENEVRKTACYQAFDAARDRGDVATADRLRELCREQAIVGSAEAEARFAEAQSLGLVIPVEGDPGFEKHREIRACVSTTRGGGAFFRNSDTNICGRTFRADNECGCNFADVPQAVIGFDFAIWFTPENDTIPAECRPAKIGGQDFSHLLICDVPQQELAEIAASPKYQNDLTGFCNDRFAKNVGMLAPLSVLSSGCSTTTEFCSEFFE